MFLIGLFKINCEGIVLLISFSLYWCFLMSDEKPANIFEAAAQMFGSGSKNKKKSVSDIAKRTEVETEAVKNTMRPTAQDLEAYKDISASLVRMRDMYTDLQQRYSVICEQANLSPKDLQKYLKDQNNFAQSEWQFMQSERKTESKKMWDRLGEEAKEQHRQKVEGKEARKRRRKFLGFSRN